MSNPKIVYFAGKVSKGGGYREKLFGNSFIMSSGIGVYNVAGGAILYGGPFAIGCDHGCFHGPTRHGCIARSDRECVGQLPDSVSKGKDPGSVTHLCLLQIKSCEAVHCFIDRCSCYGTLVELGIAAAFAKPIYLVLSPTMPKRQRRELWFCQHLPGVTLMEGDETTIHPDLITPPEKTYKERYREYLLSEEWNQRRKAKIKEAGGRCQVCNSSVPLEVHHRSYERVFHEELSDLIALCRDCHAKFHDKLE